MIEKTVFSDDEIVAQVKSNYNIITKDIEHEDRGSANIFYITDDENEKYVFKEFESRCKEEKILKEAQKMLDTKFSPFHISSTLI